MYQFTTRIRFSQVDFAGRLTPRAIIDLFQDCANFHSLSIGATIDYFKEQKKAWILSAWQIVLDAYPTMGDEVVVTTIAYEFTSMFGMRNFSLSAPDGTVYVRANSYWVLLDTETGRPLRVTKEDAASYGQGEQPMEMEYAPRKLSIPKELEPGEAVRVMKCHLDTNKHMNNCQYVQLAMEYLPEDFELGQIRVEYKTSAKCGDVIVPYYQMEENGLAVVLKDQKDGRIFAVVYLERRKK